MQFPGEGNVMHRGEHTDICSAEHLLDTIFHNKHKGLIVVSSRGTVRQINETLAEALGRKQEHIIGHPLTEVCRHRGLRRIIQVLKSGKPEFSKIDTIGGKSVLIDYLPIYKQNRIAGALAKVSFLNTHRDNNRVDPEVNQQRVHGINYKQKAHFTVDHIVGSSPQIIDLKETVIKVAPRNSNVLITGESGTGKELFAQAIHAASLRRSGPFVKVNCAAIPDTLLESEFFGYEEGAFTGSRKGGQAGKLELANGGTVLLDEIGDLPFSLQAKFLRFIQEKEIQKLGGGDPSLSDVRVIASTNVDLEHLVKYKKFREDLYYRLNVVNLFIPPLRERREDILDLAGFFIRKFNRLFGLNVKGISPEVEAIFLRYSWPGNVRELENVIERAFNIIEGDVINISHLPHNIVGDGYAHLSDESNNAVDSFNLGNALSKGQSLSQIMEHTEKMVILQALLATKGNKAKAAKMLGISRPGLYKKLMKYGLI